MRQRLTWSRYASAQPATPDEGAASPAHTQDDPGQDDYKNGDTSSWAEDPHPGPYPQSGHPATPDEGPASPAYKQARLEIKAAKCIKMAKAMLGKTASVQALEDQALSFMDLDNRTIQASLLRLSADEEKEEECAEGEEEAAAKTAAEAEEKEEAEEEPVAKEARLLKAQVNFLRSKLAKLSRKAGEDAEGEPEPEDAEGEEAKKKASLARSARLRRLAAEAEAEKKEEAAEEEEKPAAKEARLLTAQINFLQAKKARLLKAGAEGEPEVEDEEEAKKKAALARAAHFRRLAAEAEEEAEGKEPDANAKEANWSLSSEAMLEQMLAEEGMLGEPEAMGADGEEALFESMLQEEGMMPMSPAMGEAEIESNLPEPEAFIEDDVVFDDAPALDVMPMDESVMFDDGLDDPMGFLDAEMAPEERLLMAKLFGKSGAEEEEAEVKEEDKPAKEASVAAPVQTRTASQRPASPAQRPQPKKPSTGVTRLGGGVVKEAGENNDLAKLWETAPDVSKFF